MKYLMRDHFQKEKLTRSSLFIMKVSFCEAIFLLDIFIQWKGQLLMLKSINEIWMEMEKVSNRVQSQAYSAVKKLDYTICESFH